MNFCDSWEKNFENKEQLYLNKFEGIMKFGQKVWH